MFRKNPKIEVKPSNLDKKIIRLGWILLILNVVLILNFYSNLPETIPTHFNFKGDIDGYGPKSTLWVIPIIGMLMYYGLNLVIKKVPPHKYNYPVKITEKNAPVAYALSIRLMTILNFSIVCIFLLISINTIVITDSAFSYNLMPFITIVLLCITLLPFFFIYKMFKTSK